MHQGDGAKGHMPSQTIDFRHDKTNDVIIATVFWDIKTEEDVRVWAQQWHDHLGPMKRKVDLIIVLDNLKLDPRVGKVWGEQRAKIIKAYTRFSYRVHTNIVARTFTATSGVLYEASSAESPSIPNAIEGIQLARKQLDQGLLPQYR